MQLLEFFYDPVLRAPTLGSMLMCFASALIGSLVFLKKRSLLGEALSHAAYPGVVLSVLVSALFISFSENILAISILIGAFAFIFLGLWSINYLEKKLRFHSDVALCFVLSVFFGFGILLASRIQITHALWFREIQVFLFGQAATMTDIHILLYGILALLVVLVFVFFFRELQILLFDAPFAATIGVNTKWVEHCSNLLLVLAIVVGMRSVGVVLMSAMLIAPAISARQWCSGLASLFCVASVFGILAGFLGNFFSVRLSERLGLSFPTGPTIVLCASAFSVFSILFAPKRGYIFRMLRVWHFRWRCVEENLLKSLYKGHKQIAQKSLYLWRMQRKGWVKQEGGEIFLTAEGIQRAEKLIRLHRLWEVYLVHMGQKAERVHHSAEEMEHILTREVEKQLQDLLNYPSMDPHKQPIPREKL